MDFMEDMWIFYLDIRSSFFFKDQITTVALSLVGPREVLGHLLAENMALDNFELYKNPKTGGRRINIDWFCHLVVKMVLHLPPK